jgi:hypothetical protein
MVIAEGVSPLFFNVPELRYAVPVPGTRVPYLFFCLKNSYQVLDSPDSERLFQAQIRPYPKFLTAD